MGDQYTLSEFSSESNAGNPDSCRSPEETYNNAEWLREQYHKSNRATTDIADELGVAVSTICNWLNKHNINTKSNLVAQTGPDAELLQDREWLRTEYSDKGRSCEDIGDGIGVSDVTVLNWLKKHGIDRRSASEARAEGEIKPLHNSDWLREQYIGQQRSTRDIAEELGVSRKAVSDWLDRHNIKKPVDTDACGKQPVEELKDEEWLREQYVNQERSTYDIADELGVARSTVCGWMRKHSIEFRSPSQRVAKGDISPLKDEDWLREQYVGQERPMADIAEDLELSTGAVESWLQRYGIDRRSAHDTLTDGDLEPLHNLGWIREQYVEKDQSTYDIADELDVDRGTVSNWLERHGIDTRGNTEAFGSDPVEELQDAEWLYQQYHGQERSCDAIASEVDVAPTTVRNWMHRHNIEIHSGLQHPDHLDHPVRSGWELTIAELLIQENIEYEYESLQFSYDDGRTYTPDFVTDSYVIEVKGRVYGGEERRAKAAIDQLDNREYVVVGTELPADHHIPWEDRTELPLLFK